MKNITFMVVFLSFILANISFNKSGLYPITCDVYTSTGEYYNTLKKLDHVLN